MTTYPLFSGLSASQNAPGTTQGGPPGSNLPPGSQMAAPAGGAGGPTSPPTNQSFQLTVTASNPGVSCSATAQAIVSNDGVNWMNYGNPIVAAAGASPNLQGQNASGLWAYFSAYLTAITGTGAKATLTMAA